MKVLPITLRPTVRSKLPLLLGCGALVAAGLWLYGSQPFFGALLLLIFGIGFIVGVVAILPNSAYLYVAAEGFTFVSFFRKHFVPWECVDSFRGVKLGLNNMVGWNYAAEYKMLGSYAPANLRLAGVEAVLPDRYGMSVEGLCGLMNEIALLPRNVSVKAGGSDLS